MKKWLLPALVLALIGTSAPASATVLFAGGEDISFTLLGAVTADISEYRTTFARSALNVSNGTTVADPPANRYQTPTFTPTSTIWIHAQTDSNVGTTSTLNEQGLIIRSPDGVSRIVVRQTATAGQLKVSTRNAAGTITDLATDTSNISFGITQFDLYVNYTCSGSGGVQLYLNGAQVINYTGNPCTDSATTLNQVEFAGLGNSSAGGVTCVGTCWSEIIITDTQDTRSMALWTMPPQAAGNTQSWSGTVGDINETTLNNALNISTSSSNALSEWTLPTTIPSGSWNVLAVVQEAEVEVATTGPQHFGWVARTGGSDYVSGSVAPLTSFSNFSGQIWATNPNTGVAWTTSNVTAAGFNLGIESLN